MEDREKAAWIVAAMALAATAWFGTRPAVVVEKNVEVRVPEFISVPNMADPLLQKRVEDADREIARLETIVETFLSEQEKSLAAWAAIQRTNELQRKIDANAKMMREFEEARRHRQALRAIESAGKK